MPRSSKPRPERRAAGTGRRPSIRQVQVRIDALRRRVARFEARAPRLGQLGDQVLAELHQGLEELQATVGVLMEQSAEIGAAYGRAQLEQRRYQELFQSAPDGYLVTDGAGVIEQANLAAGRLLGVRPGFLAGKPIVLFLPRRQIFERVSRLQASGGNGSAAPLTFEADITPRSRPPVPAAVSVARTAGESAADTRLLWLIRDVSRQKDAERMATQYAEQAHRLSRRILQTQEDERAMLARDLHDEIGQHLVGIKLNLATAGDGGRVLPNAIADAIALVDQVVTLVRRVAFHLRPPTLDLGLGSALRSLSQYYAEQARLSVSIDDAGVVGPLDAELSLIAYRIAQEALTNVVRHAGIDRASVRLQTENGWLHVEVADGGRGFDPDRAMHAGTGNGLIGMRERAALVNGHLVVESSPDHGTRIAARLPVTQDTGRRGPETSLASPATAVDAPRSRLPAGRVNGHHDSAKMRRRRREAADRGIDRREPNARRASTARQRPEADRVTGQRKSGARSAGAAGRRARPRKRPG